MYSKLTWLTKITALELMSENVCTVKDALLIHPNFGDRLHRHISLDLVCQSIAKHDKRHPCAHVKRLANSM